MLAWELVSCRLTNFIGLILHHFLDANDVKWLSSFEDYKLSEDQKRAVTFTREMGAIDNSSYRQLNEVDVLKASTDLGDMRTKELLDQKGKGRATYYVVGKNLLVKTDDEIIDSLSTPVDSLSTPVHDLKTGVPSTKTPAHDLKTPAPNTKTPAHGHNEFVDKDSDAIAAIVSEISELGPRINDASLVNEIILKLCKIRPFKAVEIAKLFNRQEDYFKRKYLTKLISNKELSYTYPDMINHPDQAYITTKTDK